MPSRYFSARFFNARFFEASGASFGYYFGSRYFAANYFATQYYRPGAISGAVSGDLDATEAADTLESVARIAVPEFVGGIAAPFEPLRLLPKIHASLDVTERGDTLESTVTLGPNPVEMDNSLLLLAA